MHPEDRHYWPVWPSSQEGRESSQWFLNVRSSCWIFHSLQGCYDIALTVPDQRVLASRGKCEHHIQGHATQGGIIAALLPEPPHFHFCLLKSFLRVFSLTFSFSGSPVPSVLALHLRLSPPFKSSLTSVYISRLCKEKYGKPGLWQHGQRVASILLQHSQQQLSLRSLWVTL